MSKLNVLPQDLFFIKDIATSSAISKATAKQIKTLIYLNEGKSVSFIKDVLKCNDSFVSRTKTNYQNDGLAFMSIPLSLAQTINATHTTGLKKAVEAEMRPIIEAEITNEIKKRNVSNSGSVVSINGTKTRQPILTPGSLIKLLDKYKGGEHTIVVENLNNQQTITITPYVSK